MNDRVERLRDLAALKHDDLSIGNEAADEIEELRKRLHEVSLDWQDMRQQLTDALHWKENYIEQVEKHNITLDELAGSLAREAELREYVNEQANRCAMFGYPENPPADLLASIPTDDTALKEAIEQAKKEVLLEAANIISQAVGQPGNDWGEGYTAATKDASRGLHRMAEELK
jgi:hypothetical protein